MELRIRTGKGSKETSTPLQYHLLQQAPKARNQPGCLGPHTPFSGSFKLQPNPQDAVPDATSEQREKGGKKKCHLVNDKLFQSHSSDTKCPGPWTAQASCLWVGGRQLSTSRGAIAQGQAPRSPCTSGQTTVPIPAGRRLLPVPTTLANSPLGLQPEARLSLLLQSTERPQTKPEATSVALLQRPSTERN